MYAIVNYDMYFIMERILLHYLFEVHLIFWRKVHLIFFFLRKKVHLIIIEEVTIYFYELMC